MKAPCGLLKVRKIWYFRTNSSYFAHFLTQKVRRRYELQFMPSTRYKWTISCGCGVTKTKIGRKTPKYPKSMISTSTANTFLEPWFEALKRSTTLLLVFFRISYFPNTKKFVGSFRWNGFVCELQLISSKKTKKHPMFVPFSTKNVLVFRTPVCSFYEVLDDHSRFIPHLLPTNDKIVPSRLSERVWISNYSLKISKNQKMQEMMHFVNFRWGERGWKNEKFEKS